LRRVQTTQIERPPPSSAARTQPGRSASDKSFDVLGEYLEFGDLFEGRPPGGVL
jgi:hypothetical protein